MPDKAPLKCAIGLGMLQLFPATIRASVLEDEAFRRSFALAIDADIRLEPSGLTFRRSKLFGAIRSFLGLEAPDVQASSEDGATWKLVFTEDKENIRLTRDNVEIALPDFMCLWPDSTKRVAWFDREAEKYELVDNRAKMWRERLSAGIVEDEDVDQLLLEFRLSPLWVTQSIGNELRKMSVDMLQLIPSDIRYYDRLVGEWKGEAELRQFVIGSATSRIREIIQQQPVDGLKRVFLLSAHCSLVLAIELKDIPRDVVLQFYSWLVESGDRMSQLGGIELGFAHLDMIPDLEGILIELLRSFLADEPENPVGRPALLSSLIVMVEGEVARTGIARHRPPFWRRLATIAHASALERKIIATSVSLSEFSNWASSSQFCENSNN